MKYYRDVDYFLYFEDFPHMGIPGVTALNSDGTVNIYINTLYTPAIQARTVKHELRHMALNHFSSDWLTIQEKESEAEDINDALCTYADDFSFVEYHGEDRYPPGTTVTRQELMTIIDQIAVGSGVLHINMDLPTKELFTKTEASLYRDDALKAIEVVTNEQKKKRAHSRKRSHNPRPVRGLHKPCEA